MYKVTVILLFFIFSCNYPDIDTVPEFNSVNITLEESIDQCRLNNIFKPSKKIMIKKYVEVDSMGNKISQYKGVVFVGNINFYKNRNNFDKSMINKNRIITIFLFEEIDKEDCLKIIKNLSSRL
tara:strand:+ start:127 stop:498 length:372 start_codon:yes stop_codon:yes gene_type:complete